MKILIICSGVLWMSHGDALLIILLMLFIGVVLYRAYKESRSERSKNDK